jgi:predicted NBD/HSP70 family sugar kinase
MKREPLRGNDVRQLNEKLILNIIHRERSISQSEVVQLTGLKAPTVFRIFTNLEEEGFIAQGEGREQPSDRKGRRPVYYGTVPSARYIVGIDFWSRSAAIVLVDFAGRPVHREVHLFPPRPDAEEVVNVLCELIELCLNRAGVSREKVLGIGIGAPGMVDIDSGHVVSYNRIRGMEDFPLADAVSRRFSIPVCVHNNAAVVALSEYRYGVARGEKSLLTVLIRSGVGGSFISDRRIFVNEGKTTLEIGHMLVELDGPRCECGRRGCLETYLSEEAILGELDERFGIGTLESLEEALASGDARLDQSLARKEAILSEGIASLYQLFSPSAFLIITRSKALSDRLAASVDKRYRVLTGVYDPSLACVGASDLVLDRFFSEAGSCNKP